MFSRTFPCRAGNPTYGNWPWPIRLPLRSDWYHRLRTNSSIARETRQYTLVGDILVLTIVAYAAYRLMQLHTVDNAYQTHLSHLTQSPPAIIANNFDFVTLENNRQVSRAALDEYRKDVVECKMERRPIETVIFKY
ncbi:hypothetical protein TRVL_09557 [Trypanosoma vivax]|nr:hypothetical protein TRVL_09557 [Trypanosoma vivax]